MSKQKTFWAPMEGRKVRHLWIVSRYNSSYFWSSCGQADLRRKPSRKGDKCKSCLRAIKN